ncbi:conjugal transfer nickase/helicase domain-containing protein, partial [Xanthomonas citri]|uniref:conjugal transfer nickase/helicase domain-containing protein n=1 Tax=Xanthomonas citri TaxID=346 RepID=UPI0035E82051
GTRKFHFWRLLMGGGITTGPRKSRRLHGYLLERWQGVFGELPPNNPYLTLREGNS